MDYAFKNINRIGCHSSCIRTRYRLWIFDSSQIIISNRIPANDHDNKFLFWPDFWFQLYYQLERYISRFNQLFGLLERKIPGLHTNIKNISGNSNGTGLYSKTITLNAYGLALPTLCVTATKQDSSNLTLTLSVCQISTNRTSLANGTIRVCSTIVL